MICPSCQQEVDNALNFCPHCGAPLPQEETTCTEPDVTSEAETVEQPAEAAEEITQEAVPAEATAPVAETAPAVEKAPKKLNKKAIIAVIAAVVVVAGIFITRAVINHMHEEAYAAAGKALAAEDYEKALKEYKELGGFKDSKNKAQFCQDSLDYEEALKLFDKGDYDKAKAAFGKLDDFKDAKEKVTLCENMVKYNQAEELFAAQNYAEAHEIYADLPDDQEHFPDRSDHMTYCENKQKYDEAAKKLADKQYYDAYCAFSALGSFEDAAAKADSCKQKFPKTGQCYRNKKFKSTAVALTIVPPKNDQRNYLKIYSGDDLVSCVALGKGKKATVRLPVGTYTIKDAYGTGPWFGDTDMFGDDGTYLKLTNGDAGTFKLKANMAYTLTLRSSNASGDNVGSDNVERGTF